MAKSRREFLTETSMGLFGAAALGSVSKDALAAQAPTPSQEPAGAPPAFGAGPGVGPEVSPATFAEAENLAQVIEPALQRYFLALVPAGVFDGDRGHRTFRFVALLFR